MRGIAPYKQNRRRDSFMEGTFDGRDLTLQAFLIHSDATKFEGRPGDLLLPASSRALFRRKRPLCFFYQSLFEVHFRLWPYLKAKTAHPQPQFQALFVFGRTPKVLQYRRYVAPDGLSSSLTQRSPTRRPTRRRNLGRGAHNRASARRPRARPRRGSPRRRRRRRR